MKETTFIIYRDRPQPQRRSGDRETAHRRCLQGRMRCGEVPEAYSQAGVREQRSRWKESPSGTTNREPKNGLEFDAAQYDEIDRYCRQRGIIWFASSWDLESQRFLRRYDQPYKKVPSAMLTVLPLVEEIVQERRHTFISTGMSTVEEIDVAVGIFRSHDCPFEVMHCHSTYPMANEDGNLRMIQTLRDRYNGKVGYSGHERGLQISLAAVALGATSIERHITLDVAMYGSDQAASLEPPGLTRIVRDIRITEVAMGDGVKRLGPAETAIKQKLRCPYWYQAMLQQSVQS